MFEVNAILATQNSDFKFVKVFFPDNTTHYTYKTLLDFEEGDTAIVLSPRSKSFVTVTVEEVLSIDEIDHDRTYKWIVDKVDTTQYEKCVEAEKAMAKEIRAAVQAKRLKDLQEQIAERIGSDKMVNVVKISRL